MTELAVLSALSAPMSEHTQMKLHPAESVPGNYSLPATAAWFVAGAAVTAIFSGSLAVLTTNARRFAASAVARLVRRPIAPSRGGDRLADVAI